MVLTLDQKLRVAFLKLTPTKFDTPQITQLKRTEISELSKISFLGNVKAIQNSLKNLKQKGLI